MLRYSETIQAATTALSGKVRLATSDETNTGTNRSIAVTPDGLDDWTGSAQIVTVGILVSGDADGIVSAANLTTPGIVELATGAETNTGTDATRAVTPDGLDDWTGSAQIVTVGVLNTLTVSGDLTLTGGDIIFDNTQTLFIKEFGGTARKVLNVNTADAFTIGTVAPGWGGNLLIIGGTRYLAYVNSASGSKAEFFRGHTNGDATFGGVNTNDGQVLIDQKSTSGAQVVLALDQADVDQPFMKYIGTSDTNAARALVDAVDFPNIGTLSGYLLIEIDDKQSTNPITDGDYYVAFYTIPTA